MTAAYSRRISASRSSCDSSHKSDWAIHRSGGIPCQESAPFIVRSIALTIQVTASPASRGTENAVCAAEEKRKVDRRLGPAHAKAQGRQADAVLVAPRDRPTPASGTDRRRSGAPGLDRTADTKLRKPVLYPLSYEGIVPICRAFSRGHDS